MAADSNPHPDLPKPPPPPPRPLLVRWLRRPWPPVEVLVLRTTTCGLCEEAVAVLERHRRRLGLALRVVDITGEPRLIEHFGQEVPVVFVAGTKRFFGRVDPVLLAREVEAARRLRG